MTFEYQYGVYNPGQYPADARAAWDALVADGWQVHTAANNYNEICILWQRELPDLPDPEPAAQEEEAAPRDSLGRFQSGGNITGVSGNLKSHEGQDAR